LINDLIKAFKFLKSSKQINTGRGFTELMPLNLFPSYPFKCKCGYDAEYSLDIDNGKILHRIKCVNCNKEAIGTSGQQVNDMWFGIIPDVVDITE
jgi:hypothetical protein